MPPPPSPPRSQLLFVLLGPHQRRHAEVVYFPVGRPPARAETSTVPRRKGIRHALALFSRYGITCAGVKATRRTQIREIDSAPHRDAAGDDGRLRDCRVEPRENCSSNLTARGICYYCILLSRAKRKRTASNELVSKNRAKFWNI